MKILVVVRHGELFKSFSGILNKLNARGHSTLFLCEYAPGFDTGGYPFVYRRWGSEMLKEVVTHCPDCVITWNGMFPYVTPFFTLLQRKGIRVLASELAWLPQRGNNFMTPYRSPFQFGQPQSEYNSKETHNVDLSLLRSQYKVTVPQNIPGKYVFVPMQLEQDTSISHRSPYIKTMTGLLETVECLFPQLPIVIKNHPYEAATIRYANVYQYTGNHTSLSLAVGATYVAGINSTLMTEALLFYKKVIHFGASHASDCMINGFEAIENPKLLDPEPDRAHIDFRLSELLQMQYNPDNPPDWLMENIEKGFPGE